MDNFTEQVNALPALLGGHMRLTVLALLAGILISIPAGLWAAFSRRAQAGVLTFANIVQTIPGLALLALMVPLLGGQIGFLPAFLALMLYSILPIIRNTVTGIQGVSPETVEAGHGVGMTKSQVLFRVQLPLALPVIIAGIRTAAVWVVGTATLSTPVGAPSLGNYIFQGLQTRNNTSILFGCVFAAMLAIALDQLIRLMEYGVSHRRRKPVVLSSILLAVIVIAGLAPLYIEFTPRNENSITVTTTEKDVTPPTPPPTENREIRIGSKPFVEQYILAEMLGGLLEQRGFQVDARPNMGSTVLFDALRQNEIDAYIDYSGTLWSTVLKKEDTAPPREVLIETENSLKDEFGIISLGALGFENAYSLAMKREQAEKLGIRSIEDLAGHSPNLKVAGDYEFFGRPEWQKVRDEYGLAFGGQVAMDPALMYKAAGETVDVISAYSSDGRIVAYDLLVLDDPANAFPPYDAMLLLSPKAASDPNLTAALLPAINAIPDDMMREANRRVDMDKRTPSQVGAELAKAVMKRRNMRF